MEPQVVALVVVGVIGLAVWVRRQGKTRTSLSALGARLDAETRGSEPRAQLEDATSDLDITVEDREGGGTGGASAKRVRSRRGSITVRNAPARGPLPKDPRPPPMGS